MRTRSTAAGLVAVAAVLGLTAACDWLFPRYEPGPLEVEPAVLELGAVEGDTEPIEETVQLTLGGTGPVSWTAVSDQPWLTVEPSSGSLGTWDSCEVTITANPTGLPTGQHVAHVTFSDTEGAFPDAMLTVILHVRLPASLLQATPRLAKLYALSGDTLAAQTTVTLSLDQGTDVEWTATPGEAWLDVDPATGSLSGGEESGVTLSVDPASRTIGVHLTTVTFSAPGGEAEDVEVTVAFTLRSKTGGSSGLVYYVSDIDDSLQPYGIYLPAGFVPGTGSPLAAYMHGYGGGASEPSSATKKSRADTVGMILVNLEGRGQHQFDGAAETDLFEVLADVDAAYKVDWSRVFLEGSSMGATGSFRFITRHPDVFAGAGAVDGWTDYRLWHKEWYAPAAPDNWEYHPARIVNLEYASPLTHAENILPDRLFMRVDTGDIPVYSEGDPKLHERLVRLGTSDDYGENAGGHTAAYGPNVGNIYDFFISRAPLDLDPPSVRVRSNRLRTAKSFWLQVDRFAWNGWAEVTATRTVDAGTCTYDLTTRNARRFTIATPPEEVTPDRYVVIVDGVTCVDEAAVSFPLTVDLSLDAAGSVASGSIHVPPGSPVLEKRPAREGPIMRALTERFIVAYGSLVPAKTANNKMNAEQLCKAWTDDWSGDIDTPGYYGFNSVILPVDEATLSPADLASAHLVIFGTEESSSLISDMATSAATPFNLPTEITIAEDQIVLDGEVFSTTDHGIWMIYANPLAPGKLVVIGHNLVGSGADGEWGEILWTRESWPWAWPDYVVFDTDAPMCPDVKGSPYAADQYVRWGFFDQDWALVAAADPRTVVGAATDQTSYTVGTATSTVTVTVEDKFASPVSGLDLVPGAFDVRIDGELRPAVFVETAAGVYEADVAISDLIVAGYDLTVEVIRPVATEPVVGIGRARFGIQ